MILTPEERRALLGLSLLLIIGQILALWQRRREERIDPEFESWIARLEAGPDTLAVEPARSAPPGWLDDGRLRIDLAGPDDLERLPGIGPALAARIVAERRRRPFREPRDLLRVPGIGPKTLEALLPRVRCGRPDSVGEGWPADRPARGTPGSGSAPSSVR